MFNQNLTPQKLSTKNNK